MLWENQSTSRKRGEIITFDPRSLLQSAFIFRAMLAFYLFFCHFFREEENNGRASFNFYLKSAAELRGRVTRVLVISVRSRRGKEKHHYQMASSKGKARDRPRKKRIAERKSRANVRSRVKSTRRKRVDIPHRRLYDSVSIPQLVYELLTIDKYNQGVLHNQHHTTEV